MDDCSSILLYTDGLTEARNPHGEFFGERRLERWLQQAAAQSHTAYELSWKFMSELKSFQSQVAASDDQTFLILAKETHTAEPAREQQAALSDATLPLALQSARP